MNARNLLIPLLCLGALALACGPESRSESSLLTAQIVKPAKTLQGTAEKKPKSTSVTPVTGKFVVHVEQRALRFALDLTNESSKSVELAFPNGQTHDFVVMDSAGREVYRWAEGRMFTQSVQTKPLDHGETMRIGERTTTALPHGSYVAVATLRSSNFPVQERVAFELR